MIATESKTPAGAARPLVKWTGGKGSELPRIAAAAPASFGRLLEPFVGGGAVLFSTPPSLNAEANDMSGDLVALYRAAAARDTGLRHAVEAIDCAWESVGGIAMAEDVRDDIRVAAAAGTAALPLAALHPDMPQAVSRFAVDSLRRKRAVLARLHASGDTVVAQDSLLASALKGAVYTAIREACNTAPPGSARTAMFWFLREFCYGGMFRSNSSGGSNVPYGGMSYDGRSMAGRLAQLEQPAMQARLAATRFHQGDFETFLQTVGPRTGDFVFLDPPYDSPFSAYDGNAFTRADHTRLAAAMARLPCDWMIVISETPFVRDTYCSLPGARTVEYGKNYAGNIKQRFDRRVTHLMVTNYAPGASAGQALKAA